MARSIKAIATEKQMDFIGSLIAQGGTIDDASLAARVNKAQAEGAFNVLSRTGASQAISALKASLDDGTDARVEAMIADAYAKADVAVAEYRKRAAAEDARWRAERAAQREAEAEVERKRIAALPPDTRSLQDILGAALRKG